MDSSTPQVRVGGDAIQNEQPTEPVSATTAVSVNATDNEIEMSGTNATGEQEPQDAMPDIQEIAPAPAPAPAQQSAGFNFLNFLTSPIVEITVGKGEHETTLKAHQNLLVDSPFLAELADKFEGPGARKITLPEENIDAFSCFLEFQYTRDYAEPVDTPGASEADKSKERMLRHARIYTLAEKLGLPALKSLAHGKIHEIKGTPEAELAYARYVYTYTPAEDTAIRRPVASHWANWSHILRHKVNDGFKTLCIEVPQFSFDVLSIILDRKEKSLQDDGKAPGSARKRTRREI